MKTKKNRTNDRTMVVLYAPDVRAIEKLRDKFSGLPDSRYHSEVMRRAVEKVVDGGMTFSDKLQEACEHPAESDAPSTKYAVVLRELEKPLERFKKEHKCGSMSAALRLILRGLAGGG